MINFLDKIENATNTYRTKYFIITQELEIVSDVCANNEVISHDTYFKRSKWRDKQYEYNFKTRKNINGKRLQSTMQSKIYVD